MKPFKKLHHFYFIASVLSTLATSVPIASADTITVVETHNNFPNGSTSEMVRPRNHTYGYTGPTIGVNLRHKIMAEIKLS
jgi:hypothetical protein